MKILMVSKALPYLPSRGGFRLYGGNLLRHLSRHHSVDLISYLEEGDQEHLDWPRQYCSSVSTISVNSRRFPSRVVNAFSAYIWGRQLAGRHELNAMLRAGQAARRWDVLHVEGAIAGGAISEDLRVPRILSVHDSWTLRVEEMLKCTLPLRERFYYTFLKYQEPRYERLVYPRFEAVTVVADPDFKEVRKVVPNANVVLIPYGTDTEYFYPVPVEKEPKTLVFHSHLGYPPNIDAALELANEIFPLIRKEMPDALLHLVGANPGPRIQELAMRPGIKISANLPDLRPAVCSGSVYVCAIRYGTGLKSKMLEAMAMRMPIVAYHPGSTVGIECVYGKHLLAAENPQEFAAHVLDLLKSPTKAEQLAKAARELVCEKYCWDSRARAYEELYQRAIEQRYARSSGSVKRI